MSTLNTVIPQDVAERMRLLASKGKKAPPEVQPATLVAESDAQAINDAAAAAVAAADAVEDTDTEADNANIEDETMKQNSNAEQQNENVEKANEASAAVDITVPAPAHSAMNGNGKAKEPSTFVRINLNLAVTLDLTQRVFRDNAGAFKQLARFKAEGSEEVTNLFNLFRAVPAKAKDKGIARGAVRSAFSTVLRVAADFDNQQVMLLGKRSDLLQHVRSTAVTMADRVRTSLGIPAEEQVISFEGGQVLTFSDLVRVTSWAQVAGSTLDSAAGADAESQANIYVNMIVNSAALYSSDEMDKMVTQIRNFIGNLIVKESEKLDYTPTVLFGVAMRASSVFEEHELDLIQSFAADKDKWEVYDRHDLYSLIGTDSDWVPPSKAAIDTALLPPCADMLFISMLPDADEGEEGGEE